MTKSTLAFVFVPLALTRAGTALKVSLFGSLVDATVLDGPVFDPSNDILRGSRV